MDGELMDNASILALIITFGFYLAWKVGRSMGQKEGVEGTLMQLEDEKIIRIDDKGEIKKY
jgi:hypothetical protein